MTVYEKKRLINILLVVFWAVVNLILLIYHEPWRDEAQAWLIARDLTVRGVIKQMCYEGHSCFWHLLLMPFVKLGFPYFTQNVFSYLIVLIAVIYLVWRAPFSYITKLLIILSPLCTYYYPVIARCYCLIPLLIFLIADFYENRRRYPFRYMISIALLVQTHLIMIPAAFVLCMFFWGK